MTAQIPVMLQMWFADGASWAYHPFFSENKLFIPIVYAVSHTLTYGDRDKKTTITIPFKERKLVGVMFPQENCQDPKAVNRSPFVFLVAYLSFLPTPNQIEAVAEELCKLNLPERGGKNTNLWIKVE